MLKVLPPAVEQPACRLAVGVHVPNNNVSWDDIPVPIAYIELT